MSLKVLLTELMRTIKIVYKDDKPHYIAMGVGFVLFVPMLVRELLSLRKKKKE